MYSKKLTRAYQMAPSYIPNTLAKKQPSVRTSLGGVDRDDANIEAEGGETLFLPDKNGLPAHYKIHGPRHTNGGVPLSVPPDSFVFSDTAALRIKDEHLQEEFGMPIKKKGYTPAEIAKRYEINKYRKIIQDVNSDKLQVNTAEQNLANAQVKLGKLALIQEAMKGYPDGIPMIALPYMAKYKIEPQMLLPVEMNPQGGQMAPAMQPPMARYGGSPLQQFAGGGGPDITENPEGQINELDDVGFFQFRKRRELRKAAKEARKKFLTEYYMNELKNLVEEMKQDKENKSDDGDPSTGTFVRYDSKGNIYYVDGRGIRIKSFDDAYYGPNNVPTEDGDTKIIEKNGKRYRVSVTKKKVNEIDKSKVKPKDQATRSGDIYEENGKYYEIGGYDDKKPIKATVSGQTISPEDFDKRKAEALNILRDLEAKGHAKFNPSEGWTINASARNYLTTAQKEFLTDFMSLGKMSGKIGAGNDVSLVIRHQNSKLNGNKTGFYGYVNPDFYEYRYWKAKNQDRSGEDWDKLSADEKLKNRKEMLYSLGYNLNDPHISKTISDPNKLYNYDFISNKGASLSRPIKDADGKEYQNANFTNAVEAFFKQDEYRPGRGDDNQLGLEHADAFTFARNTRELPAEGEEEVTTEEEIKDKKDYNYIASEKYSPWWMQDIVKMAGAAADFFDIRKYRPSLTTFNPYIPRPTFYDPSREIAAIQETAGIAGDVLGASGMSAQARGARLSQLQGTAAESIANVMGKYNNLNVGVANEFEYKKSDIINESSFKNAQFTKQYIDELNALNQNYDNAKRAARNNFTETYANAITNKAKAQVLNTLYPNYQIDPMSGGELSFYKGKDMEANENAGLINSMTANANAFTEWYKQNSSLFSDPKDAAAVWNTGNKSRMSDSANQNYFNAYNNMTTDMQSNPNVPYTTNPMGDNYTGNERYGGPVPFMYNTGYDY